MTRLGRALAGLRDRVFSPTPTTGIGQFSVVSAAPTIEDAEPQAVFETLRNKRRRYTIQVLAGCDPNGEWIDLRTVAEDVASIEYDMPVQELSHRQFKRVYTSLQQCHAPKLAAVDAVAFDRRSASIRPGENTDAFAAALVALDPLLDAAADGDDLTHREAALQHDPNTETQLGDD